MSNEYIVRAIIPHAENPNLHIVNGEGHYPEAPFLPEHRTYEGTLDQIGRALGAQALSVDRRIPSSPPRIDYRVKPTTHELPAGYQWQAVEAAE